MILWKWGTWSSQLTARIAPSSSWAVPDRYQDHRVSAQSLCSQWTWACRRSCLGWPPWKKKTFRKGRQPLISPSENWRRLDLTSCLSLIDVDLQGSTGAFIAIQSDNSQKPSYKQCPELIRDEETSTHFSQTGHTSIVPLSDGQFEDFRNLAQWHTFARRSFEEKSFVE